MKQRTKKLTGLAMLSAIAYIMVFVGRIPVVMFLKYDPKDVIITIGGFIFGPLSAFAISLVVSLVEMFTISDTGPIGLIMNIISTCAFACTAAFIYKKKRTVSGAVTGLITGMLLMIAVMLLWNYLITPLYMKVDREQVAAMLVPVFLPFNLAKGGLNAAITMLIYKPVVTALRKAHLLPPVENGEGKGKINVGVMLAAALVLGTCILLVLVLRGLL